MKMLLVKDCNEVEHHLNIEFIYDLTIYERSGINKKPITSIHLRSPQNDESFANIKTFEGVDSLKQRINDL